MTVPTVSLWSRWITSIDFRFSVQTRLSPGYYYAGDITAILESKHITDWRRLSLTAKYISHEPHPIDNANVNHGRSWNMTLSQTGHISIISIMLMDWWSVWVKWNIFAVGKWRSFVIIWSCSIPPEAECRCQDQHLLNVAFLTTGSHRSTFETVTVKNQWCKH